MRDRLAPYKRGAQLLNGMWRARLDFDAHPVLSKLVLKRARIPVTGQFHDDMEIRLPFDVDSGDTITEPFLESCGKGAGVRFVVVGFTGNVSLWNDGTSSHDLYPIRLLPPGRPLAIPAEQCGLVLFRTDIAIVIRVGLIEDFQGARVGGLISSRLSLPSPSVSPASNSACHAASSKFGGGTNLAAS